MARKSGSQGTELAEAGTLDRLKIAVRKAGGSTAVARKSGIPLSTLNDYLKGNEVRFSRMATLAKSCDVSLDWLATGLGDNAAPIKTEIGIFKPEILNAPPHYMGLATLIATAREFHEKVGLRPTLLEVLEWISPHYIKMMAMPDINMSTNPPRVTSADDPA